MAKLPTIKLDTTLNELYQQKAPNGKKQRIGQVLCGVSTGINITPHFPKNTKYIYQDSAFNSVPKSELRDDNTELRRSLAEKYLSLVPQREAFNCGAAPVILFNVGQSEDEIAHDKTEAEKTLGILTEDQRPEIIFCPGPAQIPVEKHNIDALAYKVVLDTFEGYPLAVPLETHWWLNTKEALATSGLPTPKTDIIEVEGHAPEADSCCEDCKQGEPTFIPTSCSGVRGQWLDEQITRIITAVATKPIPFVLKNQQTYGGAGTYVVTKPHDREELISDFSSGLLRKLLSQITSANVHLKPGSVMLSDMVADPVGDYGITFFVHQDGSSTFLAASEQMTDESHAWVGSNIRYPHQAELKKRFTPLVEQISKFLHEKGYYGPVGADALETKSQKDGSNETELNVVDLNVRTSGSICLPLLRTHFEKRGLTCASSFSITTKDGRDEFIERWQDEFESGRMCILSWYEDKPAKISIADVAIGAKDDKKLQEAIEKVRESTDEVTF